MKIMEWAHEAPAGGHLASKKLLPKIQRHFTWPGIRKDVAEYCRGCGPCQRVGKGSKAETAPLKSLPVVGRPFDLISADFVGPLEKTTTGNRYILTVIDHATKYIEAIAMPTADAEHAQDAFTEIFSRHGTAKQLLTDRGSVFTSQAFNAFLEELGVQPLLTSSYRPQSNGTIERAHGTLKTMLKTSLETEIARELDKLLPWVLFAYRSSIHSATGFSPFQLMYGREPTDLLGLLHAQWMKDSSKETETPATVYVEQLRKKLQVILREANRIEAKTKENQSRGYDRKHKVKQRQFVKGELVLVHLPSRGKPLAGDWQGPYPILERVGKQTYLVSTPDKRIKKRQMHVNAIHRWTKQPGRDFALSAHHGASLGEIMDCPPEPTELEARLDPGNYMMKDCTPNGSLPAIEHLSTPQQLDVTRIFNRHNLFHGPIGRLKGVQHDIEVGDHAPIRQHYYRCAPSRTETMKKEVEDMLKMGVIRPSRSQWASPLILVKKPNNEWRPCVDYRQVNQITKGESYPIPRLDDLIDQVGGAAFITTLDLSKGYWQIEMTTRAQEISAFCTPFGQFEFITMPFGLKQAPMTFQRAMNQLLSGLDYATAYLDDIAIYSNTWEEHLVHLEEVCKRLKAAGLTLNAKKCCIGGSTVKYLGYQVGSGQVAPLSAKIEAIIQLPRPVTKSDVRSYLGSVGFYRRFVPYFSEIATPLTNLLKGSRKGDISLNWNDDCETAFQKLKSVIMQSPVLLAPDFSQAFEIFTDASEVGIAAVLTQQQEGVPRPVAYFSRKLLDREKRYSTVEKELLAIIAALDHFNVYVGCSPIKVHSDHRPLVWLRQCTTANQRVLRWALILSEYDVVVEHIKGSENYLADMLSRRFSA